MYLPNDHLDVPSIQIDSPPRPSLYTTFSGDEGLSLLASNPKWKLKRHLPDLGNKQPKRRSLATAAVMGWLEDVEPPQPAQKVTFGRLPRSPAFQTSWLHPLTDEHLEKARKDRRQPRRPRHHQPEIVRSSYSKVFDHAPQSEIERVAEVERPKHTRGLLGSLKHGLSKSISFRTGLATKESSVVKEARLCHRSPICGTILTFRCLICFRPSDIRRLSVQAPRRSLTALGRPPSSRSPVSSTPALERRTMVCARRRPRRRTPRSRLTSRSSRPLDLGTTGSARVDRARCRFTFRTCTLTRAKEKRSSTSPSYVDRFSRSLLRMRVLTFASIFLSRNGTLQRPSPRSTLARSAASTVDRGLPAPPRRTTRTPPPARDSTSSRSSTPSRRDCPPVETRAVRPWFTVRLHPSTWPLFASFADHLPLPLHLLQARRDEGSPHLRSWTSRSSSPPPRSSSCPPVRSSRRSRSTSSRTSTTTRGTRPRPTTRSWTAAPGS